ncbi:MAG: enoyl-CoA hydratase [Firmicutes bacterium HGW-Firmicutes-11]|jgi:3-hydroxybutyryl-CoA dehydratase|nr:MAG: enoyl-CoA hydratase [Firmicutes bacterium HGW-Firmicutes-11]
MSINERFQIGQTAEDHVIVTEKLIYETADFSGDYNPVHTSEDFARKTKFKSRIAHSLICEALVSKLIGTQLPGAGAVFINISFACLKPVYIGDEIKAIGTIKDIDVARSILDIQVACFNEREEVVVESQAKVLYLDIE